MTLKFRHPDRYLAADRSMEAASGRFETKFEEDVKPPFVSVFSHVAELYPRLSEALDDFAEDTCLVVVRDFTAVRPS